MIENNTIKVPDEPYALTMNRPDGSHLFTIYADGTVKGDMQDAAEAARVFVNEVSQLFSSRDRAVEAKALRVAAGNVGPSLSDGFSGHTSTYSVRNWLRACADQIEGNT